MITQWLEGRSFDSWREELDQQGYVVFPEVLSSAEVDGVAEALAPHLDGGKLGRNVFEGRRSNRVYALLAKSPRFAELAIHPLALAFAEAELGASCLLSACLAVRLLPGESAQPWHHDDGHITLPRPRPSCGISAFWAVDAFTESNGATEVLPGSHRWPEDTLPGALGPESLAKDGADAPDDPGARPDAVPVVMPRGSLMVAKGTLWHRGGANRSAAPRTVVTPQYCPGWARQLETMTLAVPPAVVATLPPRARELLGWSIHPPFQGYVDGVHPQRLLEAR